MGRRSHARALSVWANGLRVATWRIPARGEVELQYDPVWRESDAGRPLSLSLPLGVPGSLLRGAAVENYFDNLLPDSADIRKRIAGRFRTDSTDAFDLLAATGRDCVGAVQLLGEDETPDGFDRIEGIPLSDREVAAHLGGIVAPPVPGPGGDDAFRISIAGMQEKSALLWHGGRWHLPVGATPTTHILKLPLGFVGHMKADLTTSVENEWLCMQLLEAFELPVASTSIRDFAGQRVLCVERFDRRLHSSGTWIMRLPQEDFCQVYALPHTRKYEADGGPGLVDIARILKGSERADEDRATLLKAQILFWMLAATDGHAKNFSIQLLPKGRYQLTPLYDVISVLPVIGDAPNQLRWYRQKLAMPVHGRSRHYLLKDIRRRHFDTTALLCGYGPVAEPLVQEILEKVPGAIEQVHGRLPRGFPQRVVDAIFTGLQDAGRRLHDMRPA
ncbi:type II toxin-antitoxin system HipA family toxin [Ramlibacter sp. USB13]|uniref:Type II toxin-antitoxin system HipA family toxin n=1 Tax=Ramlibacter cellulosilyticus TaxID=2764187 RepID=A0A923MVS7_9BURK|nr:type II toxin-antitoxin system HipA family toxin [Ramlibacter cellulosilyticus]MBC5785074.1 type II toxin-antitoxin system HipA family toxin [Ramlibacter cellulosilyticus]